MKIKLMALLLLVISCAMQSDKPAYLLFDKNGKMSSYEKLLNDASNADIVLFGEMHDNPICHWLQLELCKDLYKTKKDQLVLGAEMFETDNQLLLDEYISGKIKAGNFEAEAKLWPNYKTDYKALVEFARKNKIPFIATNIPRRYASLVNKSGFEALETLSKEAKSLMVPLPFDYNADLNCYKQMLKTDSSSMGASSHITPNLPKAQAAKDATMAHFILKNFNKGNTFLHFNGSYHSDDFESMVWYLKEAKPKLKILTISSIEQETIDTLSKENFNKADYILCIPESMSKTH
ncbi:MAG: ChaN family lipoprotein [Bacteroidales bacterium]